MSLYYVVAIFDASQLVEVNAASPEEAYDLGSKELGVSLCHECSRELNLGDIVEIRVDEDGLYRPWR